MFHKIWKTEDYKTPLKDIIDSQTLLLSKNTITNNLFDKDFLRKFPEINDVLKDDSMQITVENVFFIKGTDLWYFVGTDDGKVLGFPVVQESPDKYFMVKD